MRYTTRIIVPPKVRRSGPPGSPGGAYGPQVLGVRKTMGFGDRLGVATSAHIAVATAHPDFAPVFAQQSAREMALLTRTPADVVGSAARAVSAARFRQPWGADADRLQTAQQVADAAEAGFTLFTFDLNDFVRAGVDALGQTELQNAIGRLIADGDLPDHWAEPYLDRTIDLPGNHQLRVTLEPLQRAVVRYAPAVLHCARLSSALARSNQGRPFEVEVALDGVDVPTSTLEHLFIGLELEARGVRMTSLALTYPAPETNAAVDPFERQLAEHAAVAEFCGPYKLSFDEAVHDIGIYPVVGRVCGEALHVKTSAASYLEALRVVSRVDPDLYQEIALFSLDQVEASEAGRWTKFAGDLREILSGDEAAMLLDQENGRRCLDAAFASVLTASRGGAEGSFKDSILKLLDQYNDLYAEALFTCFEQRMTMLNQG